MATYGKRQKMAAKWRWNWARFDSVHAPRGWILRRHCDIGGFFLALVKHHSLEGLISRARHGKTLRRNCPPANR